MGTSQRGAPKPAFRYKVRCAAIPRGAGAYHRDNLDAIRAGSLELARDILGLNLTRRGSSWKALCPFHNEATPSFDYRDATRTFRCFGCGWDDGDIFALYCALHPGSTFLHAVAALGACVVAAGSSRPQPSNKPQPETARRQVPAPIGTPEPPRHSCCVGRWRYADAEGRTLGYQDRIDDSCGKRFVSWRWNGSTSSWEPKAIERPRPLYGLSALPETPSALVLVCEGEKAADAARIIFPNFVCVTSMGGSSAARSTDWTPLTGRAVSLWPDNDAAGYRYARDVAAILGAIGTPLLVVRPSGALPAGWDLADPMPASIDRTELSRMLSEARSLSGSPK